MGEIIALALIALCAAGTWKLSRHVHPALLILVGFLLRILGGVLGGAFPMQIGPAGQKLGNVQYIAASLFFPLLQVLGLVVIVHGAILWFRKRRKATRQQHVGQVSSESAPSAAPDEPST